MGRYVFEVEAIAREDFFCGQEQCIGGKSLSLRKGGIERFAQGDDLVDELNVWCCVDVSAVAGRNACRLGKERTLVRVRLFPTTNEMEIRRGRRIGARRRAESKTGMRRNGAASRRRMAMGVGHAMAMYQLQRRRRAPMHSSSLGRKPPGMVARNGG